MTFPTRKLLAAAAGLWITHSLPAQEPARLGVELAPRAEVSSNQRIANSIADNLRQSGHLRGYNIDIAFKDGTAEVRGTVADQPQRDEALRIVQGVPGVERVLDRLTAANSVPGIVQVGDAPKVLGEPTRVEIKGGGPIQEPMPIFQAPAGAAYEANPPKMPPYAWPTYAPYNNLSRVAYPEAYPYNAWPFIGPMYPFPKIPPGWRSVKLEWQDGHWWYSRVATKHDWWRIRYW